MIVDGICLKHRKLYSYLHCLLHRCRICYNEVAKKNKETIKSQRRASNCLAQNLFYLEEHIYARVWVEHSTVLRSGNFRDSYPSYMAFSSPPISRTSSKVRWTLSIALSKGSKMNLISMGTQVLYPFTLICSGPTGSSKTQFVELYL